MTEIPAEIVASQILSPQIPAPRERVFLDETQGMALVGLHARFLQVNSALCEQLGYSPDWLLERTLDELLFGPDAEADRCLRDQLIVGARSQVSAARRLVTAEGGLVRVLHVVELQRDEHGMPLYFVSRFPPR